MADEQDAPAAFVHPFADHPKHIGLGRYIQHGGRFIQNQELGAKQKASGDCHALRLSTGNLMRQVGQNVRFQSYLVQHILGQFPLPLF